MKYRTLAVTSLVLALTAPSAGAADLIEALDRPEAQAQLTEITRAVETRNKLTLLHLGKTSGPARLKLIDEARQSIFMSIPLWFSDDEGELTLAAFSRKRREIPNFDMRFMTDWSSAPSTGDPRANKMHKRLKEVSGGATLRWNPPSHQRGWSGNIFKNRMHEKLFIVDGEKLVMGGMNISDTYLQGGLSRRGWHDTDILIEGPVVHEATKLFLKNWELTRYLANWKNHFPKQKKTITKFMQQLYYEDRLEFKFREAVFQSSKVRLPWEDVLGTKYYPPLRSSQEHSVPIRLIFDTPFADEESKTRKVMEFLFVKANQRVRIFTPYLTLSDELRDLLIRTAKRGVQVEILTNSLDSHDLGDFSYLGAVSHYKKLMEGGVRIFEWKGHGDLLEIERQNECTIPVGSWPGHTLHTKAVVIDGSVSLIGSHNLNVRSEDYNSEVMALVRDRSFAEQLERIWDEDMDLAEPRTVTCGDHDYSRPQRSELMTAEKLKKILKKDRLKILILKHFQHLM